MRQWSFSSLSTYEQCPRRYFFEKLSDEPKAPSGRAVARGTRVHEQVEQYLKGVRPEPPKEFLKFSDELNGLIEHEAVAEMELAFDENWKITDWETGWTRGKLDAVVPDFALVVDFKTGRHYQKHREQAQLYALYAHTVGMGGEEGVTVEFWYLDLDDVTTWTFAIADMNEIRESWEKRAAKLEAEEEWNTNPSSFNCKWCSYKDICPDAEVG